MKKSVTRPFSKGISFLFLLGSFASTIHAATLTANYDSFFKAPACLGSGSGCQTNAVNGRAAITNGPESGAPNTVFSQCADGVSGYYHSDESIDSLSIISNDGTNLAVGKIVTVTANVWAYGPSGDTLDVFYATNANSPVWTLKGSVAATKAGAQNLSVSFPLQAGATQAVRASFRYLGSATPCTMGGYDDHDDMVFAVTGSSATTPPTVVVSTPVQNGSYGAVVSFNGTASASAGFKSIQVGIDTTPNIYLTASTIWSYLLDTNYMTEGAHTFTIKVTDNANLTASQSVGFYVNNAGMPISISQSTIGQQGTGASGATVILYASTNKLCTSSVEYGTTSAMGFSVAGSTYPKTFHQFNLVNLLFNKDYFYRFKVTDKFGNTAYSPVYTYHSMSFVGTALPKVGIVTPTFNQVVGTPVMLSGTATDDKQVVQIVLKIDNGNPIVPTFVNGIWSYQLNWNLNTLTSSSHTLTATATDDLGQTASAIRPFLTPIVFTSVSVSSLQATMVKIKWYTNALTTTEIKYGTTSAILSGNASFATLTSYHEVTLLGLIPGTQYFYQLKAVDGLGQTALNPIVTFTTPALDVTPPVISNLTVFPFPTSVNVSWQTNEATDGALFCGSSTSTLVLKATDAAFLSGHFLQCTGLSSNTTYYYYVRSKDSSGNAATSAIGTFKTTVPDTTPPTVAISSPQPNQVVFGNYMISGTANDAQGAISTVEISIDGAGYVYAPGANNWAYNFQSTFFANGSHTVAARARDLAGNYAYTPTVVFLVNNDSVVPTVSITGPSAGATVSGTVLIYGQAQDNISLASVRLYMDNNFVNSVIGLSGNVSTAWSFNYNTQSLVDGVHTFKVDAIDARGNISTAVARSITVANGVPAAVASYDPVLRAPKCGSVGATCDSGLTLNGRAAITNGAEINQPNTIYNSCSDGQTGAYHSDESIDRIKVTSVDNMPFAAGKTVKIDVTVWAFSAAQDYLDLYYAANATSPNWMFLGTFKATGSGLQTISTTFGLQSGSMQAIRASWRYLGAPAACTTGSYDDHDDLVFAVGSTALAANGVAAQSSEMKIAAFYGGPTAIVMKDVYTFPNPAKNGANPTFHIECGVVDAVELTVFDPAGTAVHTTTLSGEHLKVVSDVAAYEYTWDSAGVPSGVYTYLVVAKKNGLPDAKATKSLMLVK